MPAAHAAFPRARARRIPISLLPAILGAAALWLTIPAQAQDLREDSWMPNGPTFATLATDSVLYVGGTFDLVTPATGCAVAIVDSTGEAALPYPHVHGSFAGGDDSPGTVYATIPDGNGGWYLGGDFTQVQGQTRHGLAQLDAAGNVTAWDPGTDAAVRALTLSGSVLYAGGDFTSAGGQARNYIAALDTATGAATSWNPSPDATVYALLVYGGVVYVGGDFYTIGGQTRYDLASLDPTTGAATSWNPSPGSAVFALALRVTYVPVSSATLYVGGRFTDIGGVTRSCLASFDINAGPLNTPTSWDPNVHNQCILGCTAAQVDVINMNGPTAIIGGEFSYVGDQIRKNLAAVSGSGAATAWDPALPFGAIHALTRYSTTLYVGGEFKSDAVTYLAKFDLVSGSQLAWDPVPNAPVYALGVSGNTVFAGGSFTGAFGARRKNLVALSVATGAPTAWSPDPDNTVRALAADGSTLYAGGDFSHAAGQFRAGLAAFDLPGGGALTAWNPGAGGVRALVARNGTVYLGGQFTQVGGQIRNHIAAVDSATGYPALFDANSNDEVDALALDGSVLYAGGKFTNIGGFNRNRIAKLDGITGDGLSWSPNADSWVLSLAVRSGVVYAGGAFTYIGGMPRNFIAALSPTTGVATAWNPDADGLVSTLLSTPAHMFVGGSFGSIGGAVRSGLAALDPSTGLDTGWTPPVMTWAYSQSQTENELVTCLATNGNDLYAGGGFQMTTTDMRYALAAFHGGVTGVGDLPGSGLAGMLRASPNPSRAGTWLSFELPKAGAVEVLAFDAAGRRVRRIFSGVLPEGEQRLAWDGRDDAGAPVGAGVYFVRVRTEGRELRGKLLRLQ